MPEIPSFKSPTVPTLPNLSLSGASGTTLPSTTALSSIGTSVPSIPSVGGIGQSLTSNIPVAGALKSAVPTFSAPSLPTDLASSTQTQLAAKIPKFDSKIDLPEVETGKLGLLSSPTDLGAFKEKTMSSLSSMVPPFTPGVKISALNDLADKKSALMSSLKSAAGGALGAAAGVALSGGNLKNIAKSALGGAVGGAVGNLASQAGLKGNIAGALGSAAGTLATGGNLKNAAMGAGGGLVASTLTSKLGGGVIASSVGAFAGAKISGASTKSSIVGGLTAGAGAFAAQKIFSISSAPTAGATTVAEKTANIPSNVEVVTATNNQPESIPQSIPPPSPIATIDEDTGKVVLSNTDPANLTTVKETVIGGGSKTTYADKYNPDTGKYEPIQPKIEPPTKTVTTTVVNKSTGEVVSSGTESTSITAEQAKKETNNKNLSPPREAVKTKPAPKIVPRPINLLYELYVVDGNEYLRLKDYGKRLIKKGTEIVSMVGTKDTLTIKYEDASTRIYYSHDASIKKYGSVGESGGGISGAITVMVEDILSDGQTSAWIANDGREDYSLPKKGDKPYFVKNPDGPITYTFSDGTTAAELQSGGKGLITINGISAEVDLPIIVKPESGELEMSPEAVAATERINKETWIKKGYGAILQKDVKQGKITQSDADKMWKDEWDRILVDIKSSNASEVEEKYKKLNAGEQVKTAESIDKNHIIEVTRSGFKMSGDSFKIMSVRVYKKTEEVP